ncbi:hypothetical protein JHW43_006151 [Diplocarpon mali]|nr:hypothetical protein JHW43_006151 [Diplocarpon mali]
MTSSHPTSLLPLTNPSRHVPLQGKSQVAASEQIQTPSLPSSLPRPQRPMGEPPTDSRIRALTECLPRKRLLDGLDSPFSLATLSGLPTTRPVQSSVVGVFPPSPVVRIVRFDASTHAVYMIRISRSATHRKRQTTGPFPLLAPPLPLSQRSATSHGIFPSTGFPTAPASQPMLPYYIITEIQVLYFFPVLHP